ncbi:Uncharacterised protein [[Clostridium] sordellii]|nr:hypothetical protein [Paeniclostridium sordellii]CEP43279.1 Uncharacterised protein [[Clostridium] sordellii] [Paeniclostridium sordellii]
MKKLKFKELKNEELNSHGTDFWAGFGIGATAVGVVVGGVAALT